MWCQGREVECKRAAISRNTPNRDLAPVCCNDALDEVKSESVSRDLCSHRCWPTPEGLKNVIPFSRFNSDSVVLYRNLHLWMAAFLTNLCAYFNQSVLSTVFHGITKQVLKCLS